MSKYNPLQTHLEQSRFKDVPMSFHEIEKIIGFNLPASSRKHRAWWSNNGTNNVMTKAWLNAGFITAEVNLEAEKLTFLKDINKTKSSSSNNSSPPLYGLLHDTIKIFSGSDVTQPADPNWSKTHD